MQDVRKTSHSDQKTDVSSSSKSSPLREIIPATGTQREAESKLMQKSSEATLNERLLINKYIVETDIKILRDNLDPLPLQEPVPHSREWITQQGHIILEGLNKKIGGIITKMDIDKTLNAYIAIDVIYKVLDKKHKEYCKDLGLVFGSNYKGISFSSPNLTEIVTLDKNIEAEDPRVKVAREGINKLKVKLVEDLSITKADSQGLGINEKLLVIKEGSQEFPIDINSFEEHKAAYAHLYRHLCSIVAYKNKDEAKATDAYYQIATAYGTTYPDEVKQFCKEVGLDALGNEKLPIESKEFEKHKGAYAHLCLNLHTILENKGKDDNELATAYYQIATAYGTTYPDEVKQFCKEVGLDALSNEKISIESKEFEKHKEAYAHLLDQFRMLQKKDKKSSE